MKKYSIFKKVMIFSLVGMLIINAAPRKSHAIVGLATGVIPLTIAGGGIVGVSAILMLTNDGGTVANAVGFLSFFLGLVILDDQKQISPHYTALDEKSAASLNLANANEMVAFNESLSTINAIEQTIVSETNQYNTAEVSADDLNAFIRDEWATYGQYLSAPALSALTKVQSNLAVAITK